MKAGLKTLLVLMLTQVLMACDTNDNHASDQSTDFTMFVIDQISNTSDTTESVEIQQTDFVITDNETDFDSLFIETL
jgi:hypothetical protein